METTLDSLYGPGWEWYLACMLTVVGVGLSVGTLLWRWLPRPPTPTTLELCAPACHDDTARGTRLLCFWRLGAVGWMGLVQAAQWGHAIFVAGRSETLRTAWMYTTWAFHFELLCFSLLLANSVRALRGQRALLPRTTAASFEMCLPTAIFVSILYWALLAPHLLASSDPTEVARVFTLTSFTHHLFNTAALLLEFAASRLLVRMRHSLLMYAGLSAYAIWAWAQYPYTRHWPYFFLSFRPLATLVYFAIPLFAFALVLAAAGCSVWKRRRLGLPPETLMFSPPPSSRTGSGARMRLLL